MSYGLTLYYVNTNADIDAGMHQEGADCSSLLRCTTDALDEVELHKLVISTQQVNIALNVEYAVKE